MEALLQDIRHAIRSLVGNPGFTAVALLTLALGIGATTAIFSVVNAVLLRPLPYPQPDRLVSVFETNPQKRIDQYQVSFPMLQDWGAQSTSFQALAGYASGIATVGGPDEPTRVPTLYVAGNLFATLGVHAALGRALVASDATPGAEPVAVVSHELWTTRFGARADVIGTSLIIDDATYRLVGAMPAGFGFPDTDVGLWVPLPAAPFMMNRAVHILSVVGRLKPRVRVEDARTEITSIAARIQAANAGADPGHGASLMPLRNQLVGDTRPALLALLAAMGLVLLIACSNVAGLVVARAWFRRREMAIRMALGASRGRLARQLLTESVVLATLGGGAGALLATWGVAAMRVGLPFTLARVGEVHVDILTLLVALVVTLACGIGVGLWPALRMPVEHIEGTLRGTAGIRRRNRGGLVIAEISLSLVLLVGAGLLVRSYWSLRNTTPGFRTDHLLFLTTSLPGSAYPSSDGVIAFYRALPERLRAVPGVLEVSASSALPISGGDGMGEVTIEGHSFEPGATPAASYRRVLPGYFHTLGIPVIRGRDFDATDVGRDPKVIIVSAGMAARLWPGQDPIGQRIKVGVPTGEPWLTVVGVVGDVKNVGLATDAGYATYEPHPQRPWSTMQVVVRSAGDPLALAAPVRAALRTLDSRILVYDLGVMDGRLASSIAARRLGILALTAFAVIALLLTAIGLHTLLAQMVTLRFRELGVRLALGATPKSVFTTVVGDGLRLVAFGMIIGLGAAVAAARAIRHLLFGVGAGDMLAYAGVFALLLVVALLACWVPARRATRIDPLVALRSE